MIDMLLEMITVHPLATAICLWIVIILAYDYHKEAMEEELMKSGYIKIASSESLKSMNQSEVESMEGKHE